jgi:hypothetical protein
MLSKAAQKGTGLHYSGSDADELGEHARCATRVRSIQGFHMDGRGWSDIAYSYLVCKHGYTFEGRGVGIRTAANGTNSGNDGYHAVCFLGDDSVNRDDVTDTGRLALRETIEMCNAWTPRPMVVRPHSWFKPTACPGDQLRSWIFQGMPVVKEGTFVMDEQSAKEVRAIVREEVLRAVQWITGRSNTIYNTNNPDLADTVSTKDILSQLPRGAGE